MSYFLALTAVLSPAYVVKFGVFGLSLNLLMLWVAIVWLTFLAFLFKNKKWPDFIVYLKTIPAKFLWLLGIFFLAGIISLFVGGLNVKNLGQFIVLFLQPISIFFISGFSQFQNPRSKVILLNGFYFILCLAGLYGIVQYFTLFGLPAAWWGNSQEPKRALSFFVHPNFFALFSAPLLALLIPDVFESLKLKIFSLKSFAWIIGCIGLLLSLSRAGWLGLAMAIAIYIIIFADKKIKKIGVLLVIISSLIIVVVPNLRWRIILPFYGEKSSDSRTQLWQSGWKGIQQSPLLGLGLNGYSNQYSKLQPDTSLETHNFPHNIFLNFWVETGLLGLISFLGILFYGLRQGLKNKSDVFILGATFFIIALIIQGQIDNPYFKNDLALIFWLALSFL